MMTFLLICINRYCSPIDAKGINLSGTERGSPIKLKLISKRRLRQRRRAHAERESPKEQTPLRTKKDSATEELNIHTQRPD